MPSDMLKFISSYPISRRLIIAFALAAILPSVMIAIMGTYYVNQLSDRRNASSVIASAQDSTVSWSDSLQHMYTQTKIVESQELAALQAANSVNRVTLRNTLGQTVSQTTQGATQLTQDLKTYQAQYDPTLSQNMQPVRNVLHMVGQNDNTPRAATSLLNDVSTTSWPQYRAAQAAELTLLQQIISNPARYGVENAVRKIDADSGVLNSTYNHVNGDWNQVGAYVSSISKHVNGVDTNEVQPIILGTIGAFLLTLLLVSIAGVLVHRSISGPLNELVLLTKRISKGDRNARAHVSGNDEISIVATAMNSMLESIVQLVQTTQSQRDVLQGQVEKLVSEVSGIGDGDLRVSAEVTADALGVLADSFNYMVEELGSLVVRVKKVAREVGESTTTTSDRMNELVGTSDRQIEEIANAAMEIEHIAINSQQVVNRALALGSSARDARISAQGGRQAVQQTIEGMGRIYINVQQTASKVQTLGERSREINNIVDAISNIAHQTNRLALDAAIQAAMAGENGKGFGAVAADIRRLAERAKELATSVGRIVRSVRDDIGAVALSMSDTERETSTGSKLAAEAGTSLESIVAVIERQANEIEGINQMAAQQHQSSTEIVQMMQNVSESTQQSTTSTRDAAQNMERVARLAEQLLASVEAFKLRDNMNYMEPGSETFLPNPNSPDLSNEAFRTITSPAQPLGSGGLAGAFASPGGEGLFPRFSQFAATPPHAQGNGNGYSGLNGNDFPLPPAQENNGLQFPLPPAQGSNGLQFPFSPISPSDPTTPQPLGNSFSQVPFPPSGNGQQAVPLWNADGSQQEFSPQNNWASRPAQWPAANDWSAGNRNQPER